MLEPPDDIREIWEKPGGDWSDAQIHHVKKWLNDEPKKANPPDPSLPINQARAFALRHLGRDACWQDAENAWQEFNCPHVKKTRASEMSGEHALAEQVSVPFDEIIDTFDPKKGSFKTWLLLHFKQFCWKFAKKLPARRQVELPRDGDGEENDFVFVDENDPASDSLRKESQAALLDCIARLGPAYRSVVMLFYFKDYSVSEIAKMTDIGQPQVHMFRARQMLRTCLRKKGIEL